MQRQRRTNALSTPTTASAVLVLCLVGVARGDFGATTATPQQTFLLEPSDQNVIQGGHATLPCRVANKRGMLQWTRDGFGLGIERNLTGFDRYHMIGEDDEGECNWSTKFRRGPVSRFHGLKMGKIFFVDPDIEQSFCKLYVFEARSCDSP